MSRYFIIGGSGFIGSSFIEKIIQEDPEYLIFVYSRNEFSQFCLKNKLCNDAKVKFIIGDIKDFSSLNNYFSLTEPDYVIIASALKRIETCEENPKEAMLVNALGVENVCRASLGKNIKSVLYVSTDKADNPMCVYGYTKSLGESIIKSYSNKFKETNFCITRFANVLNSTGSVIPLFKELISKNRNIMLRGNDMTRFFITSNRSSQIIWDAIFNRNNLHYDSGNVLIPKCSSFRIKDLAEIMVRSSCIDIELCESFSYERTKESLVSVASLQFLKYETDEYYILDLNCDKGIKFIIDDVYSDNSKFLLSKEKLEMLLKAENIL